MVIHKIKSNKLKGYQQWCMVDDCINHWSWLNNTTYPRYPKVMNMEIFIINEEHDCYVALTYHINLNKW